jgi:hypothetical protein
VKGPTTKCCTGVLFKSLVPRAFQVGRNRPLAARCLGAEPLILAVMHVAIAGERASSRPAAAGIHCGCEGACLSRLEVVVCRLVG